MVLRVVLTSMFLLVLWQCDPLPCTKELAEAVNLVSDSSRQSVKFNYQSFVRIMTLCPVVYDKICDMFHRIMIPESYPG